MSNNDDNSNNFEKFLHKLLKRAKLKTNVIDEILKNETYMQMFKRVFSHKSFDNQAKSNYETVETLGDLVLNMAIVNYVIHKYPSFESAHWLSNIKHRLISGRSFSQLAHNEGFYPFIQMSDEKRQSLEEKIKEHEARGSSLHLIKDYSSLLEDVFEAFCGTLQKVVDDRTGMKAGPGYAVCYEFISSFLDQMEIPTTVEDVFDPISRVKEIYDSQGWPNKSNEMTLTRKNEEGDFEVTYVTVFNEKPSKRIYLGSAKSRNKKEARREAAIQTLKVLKERYAIEKTIKASDET